MDFEFKLNNITEDKKYIYLHLYNGENKSIYEYIGGIYIISQDKKYIVDNIAFNDCGFVCQLEKEYIYKIVKHNYEKLCFKVNIKLYSEDIEVDISYNKIQSWFWSEYNYYIGTNKNQLYLFSSNEILLTLNNDVYGYFEYKNESEYILNIEGIEDSNSDDILVNRIVNENIKYELIIKLRQNKTEICNINNYKKINNGMQFLISSEKINLLGNYTSLYDVYLNSSIENNNYEIRVRSDNNYLYSNIVYSVNKFYEFRGYSTRDNELSIIINEFFPRVMIKSLVVENKKINIHGSIEKIPNANLDLLKVIIGNINDKEYYIDSLNKKYNGNNIEFKFCVNIKDLVEIFTKSYMELNLMCEILLFNKIVKYNLKFNSDGTRKEDSIFYPSIVYENNLITPKYIDQDLIISLEKNYNTRFEYIKSKLSLNNIMLKVNIANYDEKISSVNSKLYFVDEANKEIEIKEVSLTKNDNMLIIKIPLKSLENFESSKSYKIKIRAKDSNTDICKYIVRSQPKKNRAYNTNPYLMCIKNSIVILDTQNEELNIEFKYIFNSYKMLKIKSALAKISARVLKYFIKGNVWLIGENLADIAQDNGFAFFEYCINRKKENNVYYVSKKNNRDKDNLLKYKSKVLIYNSLKHFLYYELSQYLIVSHGIRDVMPSIFHEQINMNKKDIIYLQHGIIAMKKVFFNKNSYNGKIEKFIASSEREKDILIKKMNFDPKQIITTGLARFDKLINTSNDMKQKIIIVMPTWRDWIINDKETFSKSKFYKTYISLLKNSVLQEILYKNNIILKFYPHIEIQKKYKEFFEIESDHIKFVNLGEETVQDLIKEASLMITDYSSVALDFVYLKKPSIFYQFDLDEYMHYRGSFIDLETDLPGEICIDENEVIETLNKYIMSGFKFDSKYDNNRDKFYKYNDKNNCERIYSEIINSKM